MHRRRVRSPGMADPVHLLDLWRNLHLADRIVCDHLNAKLTADVGCTLTEHDVLAWLTAAPNNRLRMLDLATRMRVTPGGLTRIVDRLVQRDWVVRDLPAHNRREVYAVLTETGAATLRQARRTYRQVLDETIAGHLTDDELTRLNAAARKLHDSLAGPTRTLSPSARAGAALDRAPGAAVRFRRAPNKAMGGETDNHLP